MIPSNPPPRHARIHWSIVGGLVANAVTFAICLPLMRRFRHVKMPLITRRWYDIPLRAALVATLVATVVTLSGWVGPVISGMIAGLGGALLSIWLTSWSPQAWSPIETLLLYAAIFVGGTGNNRGVMIGAVFIFVFIQEITRFIPTVHLGATQLAASRTLLIGLLIIGVLWLRPQGLLPEPRSIDKDPSKPPPEQQPVAKSELAVE